MVKIFLCPSLAKDATAIHHSTRCFVFRCGTLKLSSNVHGDLGYCEAY